MNLQLAPTYYCFLDKHVVLWHQMSNNYSIVSRDFYTLLDAYLKADNITEFVNTMQSALELNIDQATDLEFQITELLLAANNSKNSAEKLKIPYHISKYCVKTTYKAFDQNFKIITDSTKLLHLLNPALAHLKIKNALDTVAVFYISEVAGYLHLFLNGEHRGCFLKKDYNLLQGRFVMLLLGVLHNHPDEYWMASFHASTIAKNGKAVMLAGASGKGKSTLTALLAFNGFEFVSDDVTGMLYPNKKVFSYPAAISIKSGAFEVLKATIPELANQPLAVNHPKGQVKFLPVAKQTASSYSCHDIVMVHYHPTPVKAQLKPITTSKALETLIPDTWISPQPKHAKAFLDWLPDIKAYELHYHTNDDAIQIMEDLLQN